MTIIAGFKCNEGVVLCADTQETTGVSKRNIPKLRFEPKWNLTALGGRSTEEFAMAFCGATNNGPFVDKLADVVWKKTGDSLSMREASIKAEQSIKDVYREFGQIYQPGSMPDAELIYGIKIGGTSKLFRATGPLVIEEDSYASGGIGCYLADFLCRKGVYPTLGQLIIMAAYVLFQTKEHVEGCGGESHIAVLPNRGEARKLPWREVDCINKTVVMADHYLADLLTEVSDPTNDSEKIKNLALLAIANIDGYRRQYQEELQRWKKLMDDMESALAPPTRDN